MSTANTTQPRPPAQGGKRLVIRGDELDAKLRREGRILPDGSYSEQYKAEIEAYRQEKDADTAAIYASYTEEDHAIDRLTFQVMCDPLQYTDEAVAFLKGIEIRDGKGQSRWAEIDQWAARQKLEGYVRRFCDAGRARDETALNQALKDAAKLVGPSGISAAECVEAFASVSGSLFVSS
jgi:hypothetical protein